MPYEVSTGIGLLRKHVDHLKKRKHTDPLIKYDFKAPPQNSVDKAMNEFEIRERLPVSEQSLSQDAMIENTPPSPISLNNKLFTRSPDQNNNERGTPSDLSVTTVRPQESDADQNI